jgi:hypothetical protein
LGTREELAMKIESGLRLSAASLVLAIALSTGLQPAVAQTETSTQVRENELSSVLGVQRRRGAALSTVIARNRKLAPLFIDQVA